MTNSAQSDGDGFLIFGGSTWRVVSEPEVIEVDEDGAELVEVWVRRGEGIEQPQ